MRKIETLALVLFVLIASNCGNKTGKNRVKSESQKSDTAKAILVFKEYEHDFGKVAEGEKVGYVFSFDNKGTGNLLISSVTTSCGCTVPEYDSKPVPPGKTGNLEVVFNTSGRSGMQTKTISVKSNASVPVILLKITAEVVPTNNH